MKPTSFANRFARRREGTNNITPSHFSFVRKSQNYGCTWHDYGRTSLICTVRSAHSASVLTAFQRFFPAGPLALLPLWDGHYSVVWSTTPDHARALKSAGDAEFLSAVNEALQAGPSRYVADSGIGFLDDLAGTVVNGLSLVNMNEPLGSCGPFEAPPTLESLESGRFLLPLHAHHADTYYKEGQVLVGDAAHGVHPMAGQGLNLGLKGVGESVRGAKRQAEMYIERKYTNVC